MAAKFDRFAAGLGRDAFLPISFRLALRLEQIEWKEAVQDPALLTFALRAAQSLFEADGLVNWFDGWFEAEAAGVDVSRDDLGCPTAAPSPLDGPPDAKLFAQNPLVQQAIEVARRLCEETRDGAVVLGYLSGARTLLARLYGESAADGIHEAQRRGSLAGEDRDRLEGAVQTSLSLARAYGEAGVSALLLAEEKEVESTAFLGGFEPLFNLAGYYGIPVILLSRHPLRAGIGEAARRAGVRDVVAPGLEEGEVRGVPLDVLNGPEQSRKEWAAAHRAGNTARRLFISEWEIPAETPPEKVIGARQALVG